MAKLTIKDIARMAGVSTTAVSFVLNDRPGVSEATRQKVQEIIRQTEFIPNVHTRRLNLGKSFTIHVVLKKYGYDLFNQLALDTLSGIFKESKALGYNVIFTMVDESTQCEQIIDSVRGKVCDGVILNQIIDPVLIAQLRQEEIPFVCVNTCFHRDQSIPTVEVDYYATAFRAVEYLRQRGHSKIGFVGPKMPAQYESRSYAGFEDAMKQAGIGVEPGWVVKISVCQGAAEEAVDRLMECAQLPTAVLCMGDAFAVDMICAAKARGVKIPQDLSIMGVGDLPVSRYVEPALSTMTFDKELIGAKAMEMLYQIMQGVQTEGYGVISTTPVERASVKTIG